MTDHGRSDLVFALSRIEAKTKRCHWIVTPDGDNGHEWCPDCGHFKVRNLRRRDRRNRADYILDGGWRTEHDTMPMCAGCGALLDGSLTGYGASHELDYYEECGLSTHGATDALYLSEIIENLPDDDGRLELALTLGRQILDAARAVPLTPSPEALALIAEARSARNNPEPGDPF